MKAQLRKIHLYLGCFFAPILLLFILTGLIQTFGLHHQWKGRAYTPAPIVQSLAEVHMNQRFSLREVEVYPSFPFQIFVLCMSVGLMISIGIGIVMAFQSLKNPLLIWVSLISGILIPVIFLILGRMSH